MNSMTQPNEDWFDTDIAGMDLGYGEKAGLQIYRNYTRSFETFAIKRFIETLDLEPLDLTDFQRLVDLIMSEEARYLPVIVCAFADDLLKEVFKSILPDSVPGGKKNMLSGYGPLSDLAKRIQLASAFSVLSHDLMVDLDYLRSARNSIAHSWDTNRLGDILQQGRLADIHSVEELLIERQKLADGLTPLVAFRVRLIWIAGRLVYEAAAYNRAKQARLRPEQALYGKPTPKWLSEIAGIALIATQKMAARDSKAPSF
ncbi:hypothetical protein [Microvirga sp. CF3016]|uniref:hypothetical protein n=1 Tax=Microvirga sp. CF3016 TaxID=3110181 RepID=UPI002E769F28|nr:hypothetical protein [Microvirga sp. CF3016]MEE1610554.1 hypothetical protein [Microvirga sp. CF3016]